MFGDIGHGALMALFGGYLVLKEKPLAAKKIQSDVSLILRNFCFWAIVLLKNLKDAGLIMVLFAGLDHFLRWSLHYLADGHVLDVHGTSLQ